MSSNSSSLVSSTRPRAYTSPACSVAHAKLSFDLREASVVASSKVGGAASAENLSELLVAILFPFSSSGDSSLDPYASYGGCQQQSSTAVEAARTTNLKNECEEEQVRPQEEESMIRTAEDEISVGSGGGGGGFAVPNKARWQLADTARARVADRQPNGLSPSPSATHTVPTENRYLAAQEAEQRNFYKTKYTDAVNKIEQLVVEHEREREQWARETGELRTRAYEAESKLSNTESQMRFMRDKTAYDIEKFMSLEKALQEMRNERDHSQQALEGYQNILQDKKRSETNLLKQVKDLQGQLDHLIGKSSVPFPSIAALEELQAKCRALDEDNTRLTNELGRRALEFSTRLKEVTRERDAAKEELALAKSALAAGNAASS